MNLHYRMTAQEWKNLLNYLSARGCKLIDFPETDQNGLFVDFKYVTIEYGGMFFYMDSSPWEFSVCKYKKVSPYEKIQSGYSRVMQTSEQLLEYIQSETKAPALSGVHKQRIFLTSGLYQLKNGQTELQRLKYELADNREKEILYNLEIITTLQHTHDYHVLRFHSIDGNYFDYETKSRRITG